MTINKEKNRKFYNNNAHDYHVRNKDRDLSEFYQAFEANLKGKRLLDLGCGTGRDSAYFTNKGYEVTGIDFSASMLKIAKQEAPAAELIEMDITRDLKPLGTFDGIWAMASLLHLSEPDFKDTLVRVKSILKPKAPLFVAIKQEDYRDAGERDFQYWQKDKAEALFEAIDLNPVYFSETKSEKGVFLQWVLQQ